MSNKYKKGDLFTTNKYHYLNTSIWHEGQDHSKFINGYWDAVEILVKKIDDDYREINRHVFVNELVFPICFMVRHVFELQIKQIWLYLELITSYNYMYPTHHRLKKLWEDLLPGFTKFYKKYEIYEINEPNTFEEEFNLMQIQYVFDEISDIDNNSFAFRYPDKIDKTQENNLGRGIDNTKYSQINIGEFITKVRPAKDDLNGIISWMSGIYQDRP